MRHGWGKGGHPLERGIRMKSPGKERSQDRVTEGKEAKLLRFQSLAPLLLWATDGTDS